MAKLTILGMDRYMTQHDDDLFSLLTFPTGIDKDTAVNVIKMESAEFEVLYPDPYFMQSYIGVWGQKWNRTFTKWINALNEEYNPLWNYDRHEEWEDSGTASGTNSIDHTGSANSTESLTGSRDNSRQLDRSGVVDNISNDQHDSQNVVDKINSDQRSTDSSINRSDDVESSGTSGTQKDTVTAGESFSHGETGTIDEKKVSAYNSASYQPSEYETVDTTTDTNSNDSNVSTEQETGTTSGTESRTGYEIGTTKESGNGQEREESTGTDSAVKESHEENSGKESEFNLEGTRSDANRDSIDTYSDTGTDSRETSGEHSGHMWGNIGVTTSQQMLQAELDVSMWNLYQHIADLFVQEFCIPIYV